MTDNEFSFTGKGNKKASTSDKTASKKEITLLSEFSISNQLSDSTNPNDNFPPLACLEGFGGFREKLIEAFA
jgi:hypothetical protein